MNQVLPGLERARGNAGLHGPEALHDQVAALVDSWCERRRLKALGFALRGYPLVSDGPEAWIALARAMKQVGLYAADDLSPDERRAVSRLCADLDGYVARLIGY